MSGREAGAGLRASGLVFEDETLGEGAGEEVGMEVGLPVSMDESTESRNCTSSVAISKGRPGFSYAHLGDGFLINLAPCKDKVQVFKQAGSPSVVGANKQLHDSISGPPTTSNSTSDKPLHALFRAKKSWLTRRKKKTVSAVKREVQDIHSK